MWSKRRALLVILLLAWALGLSACTAEDSSSSEDAAAFEDVLLGEGSQGDAPGEIVAPPEAVPYGGWPSVSLAGAILGRSVDGRGVVVERFGAQGPVVLLMHAIHGNEATAEQQAQRMRTRLLTSPELYEAVQVLFVSMVNPDGVVADTRYNAMGIDLNRNFPASNFEPTAVYGPSPASEPETQLIVQLVEQTDPAAIVTVHAPLDAINYDGPAEALAEAMSEASGVPIDQDIGFYPGSFGSYAGIDLQIPTVTLELPASLRSSAGHEKWLVIEDVALTWTAERGGDGVPLDDLVPAEAAVAEEGYRAWKLGDSAGLRPVVAEWFGPPGAGDTPPVLVVAGLEGDLGSALVAERLRSLLLTRLGDGMLATPVLLVVAANPDGLIAGRALDNDELDPSRAFPSGFEPGVEVGDEPLLPVETALLAALVEEQQPAAALVVESSVLGLVVAAEPGGDGLADAFESGLVGTRVRDEGGRPGRLATWLASRNLPSCSVLFPATPQATDLLRAKAAALGLMAAIDSLP